MSLHSHTSFCLRSCLTLAVPLPCAGGRSVPLALLTAAVAAGTPAVP